MPLHDWTRVPSGLFHDFRQGWTVRLAAAINPLLPRHHSALLEPAGGLYPGDSTRHLPDAQAYAARGNRIAVKHRLGRTVAVIEIVSPGNKDSRLAFEDFVEKAGEFLQKGIHLLVIDPFPPGKRDPAGIHKAIWDLVCDEDFALPPGQDRTLAAYVAGPEKVAYVEPVGVGDPLPDMPVFLSPEYHVRVPLGPTYDEAWAVTPEVLREAVLTGVMPADDDGED